MRLKNSLGEKIGDNLSENVSLANYSWFNLGGNAEYFYKAKNLNELIKFLDVAKKENLKTVILGAGSNTLFRDNGVKGVVIKLINDFSFIKIENKNILHVGAATLDRKVANFAKENNLGNLEFLSCIPGSIGGAVVMNSGCYDNDISKVLISIRAIDKNTLSEVEINQEEINFSYRSANLSDNLIITSVKLRGIIGKKEEIEKKQNYFIERKNYPNQVK